MTSITREDYETLKELTIEFINFGGSPFEAVVVARREMRHFSLHTVGYLVFHWMATDPRSDHGAPAVLEKLYAGKPVPAIGALAIWAEKLGAPMLGGPVPAVTPDNKIECEFTATGFPPATASVPRMQPVAAATVEMLDDLVGMLDDLYGNTQEQKD